MSLTPDNERGLTPVAFDRDGLRLSVEPEFESRSGPQTPIPPPIQDDLLTPEGPRSTIAVMIIKSHATKLRLKIEKRIVEAGFEILKERKMGFHLDSSGVVELFGPDARSLSGDPVWVYVLSRARAASALAALAGPLDPIVARKSDPESLRALYGSNRWENGVWTTKDESSAERVVSALFAGSPIMELSDLPSVHSSPDRRKLRKSASHTSSLKSDMTTSTGSKPLSATNSRASLPPAPKPGFKARAVPASITSPTIVPRMTRAAALRAGKAPPPPVRPRMSEEERERTFEGVPGHKRRESISVSSTAPPAIVPRVNKSAMLRAQKKAEGDKPKPTKFPTMGEAKEREKTPLSPEEAKERNQIIFDGVPGHKRRESITVASTAPPAVVPRVNRSSMLRAQKIATNAGGAAPPSSFKVGDGQPTRSLSTRSSQGSIGPSSGVSRRASIAVPRPSPSKSETKANNRLSLAIPRDSSMGGALTPISNGAKAARPAVPDAIPEKAPKLSPKKPDIVPRTNKSALLRAAAKLKSAASGGSMGSMGKGPAARKSLAF